MRIKKIWTNKDNMRDNVRLGKLIYLTRSQGTLLGPTSSILYIFHFFLRKIVSQINKSKAKLAGLTYVNI